MQPWTSDHRGTSRNHAAPLHWVWPICVENWVGFLPSSLSSNVPSEAYLEAKVSLLLNHLANLSFYLLMKSEGGEVKSHPVVSQLVWLRQGKEVELATIPERNRAGI